MIEAGMVFCGEQQVTEQMTAVNMATGGVPVYATPCMIALIESTACTGIAQYLAEGEATVGSELNISHSSPSCVGSVIRTVCRVERVEGRRMYLECACYDEFGKIGGGTHTRVLIDKVRFMKKVDDKAEKLAGKQ